MLPLWHHTQRATSCLFSVHDTSTVGCMITYPRIRRVSPMNEPLWRACSLGQSFRSPEYLIFFFRHIGYVFFSSSFLLVGTSSVTPRSSSHPCSIFLCCAPLKHCCDAQDDLFVQLIVGEHLYVQHFRSVLSSTTDSNASQVSTRHMRRQHVAACIGVVVSGRDPLGFGTAPSWLSVEVPCKVFPVLSDML